MKILFLLKRNYTYGFEESEGSAKAGLLNSTQFLSDGLKEFLHIQCKIAVCIDANSIDKEVHDYKPDICVLEALWYTPEKLLEIQKLHRGVLFLVRVNSKIPFLALEGMSVGWMKTYLKNAKAAGLTNVQLSTNNFGSSRDLNTVGITNTYLPNIYPLVPRREESMANKLSEEARFTLNMPLDAGKKTIDVGCFGAIRPLKNQLIQAVAAMEYADRHKLILNFHINSGRVEQQGGEPLKNIIALFKDSGHNLIKNPWLDHAQFLELVKKMDICLQVSFTESFNIVTADTISQYVPVVVSPDIDWVPEVCKADPNSTVDIINKMGIVLGHKSYVIRKTVGALNEYSRKAVKIWFEYLFPEHK